MDEREEMRDVFEEYRRWGEEGRDSELPILSLYLF
jgi:hypothetical protein